MNRSYLHQLAIAVDQLFNALLAGYADETLSARAYRSQHKKRRWKILRKVIDGIFFWEDEHCFNSYLSEKNRKHFPEYYREVN